MIVGSYKRREELALLFEIQLAQKFLKLHSTTLTLSVPQDVTNVIKTRSG